MGPNGANGVSVDFRQDEVTTCGWHKTGLFGEPWGSPVARSGHFSAYRYDDDDDE